MADFAPACPDEEETYVPKKNITLNAVKASGISRSGRRFRPGPEAAG